MCYAVEGQGSKSFDKAKGFVYPEAARFIAKNYRYDYFIFTK
jgi:hypothetical protein